MRAFCLFLFLVIAGYANAAIINLTWNTGISNRTTLVFPNDTIVWTVTDQLTHTVDSNVGAPANFSSGNFATNYSLNTTGMPLGSYGYHCNIHPQMTGTIVLTTNVSGSDSVAPSTLPASTVAGSSVIPSSVLPSSALPSSVLPSAATISGSVTVSATASFSKANASQAVSSIVGSSKAASVTASQAVSSVAGSSKAASVAASQAVSSVAGSSQVVVASSSKAAVASSGAAAVTPSTSASSTPSNSKAAAGSSVSSAAQSAAATPSTSGSHVVGAKTITGLAAITCRSTCYASFLSCKQTSRRLRPCKRAKKQCVAQCGVVNPN